MLSFYFLSFQYIWYRYGHRIFYQITYSGYIEGYMIEIIRSTNYMVPMHAHKVDNRTKTFSGDKLTWLTYLYTIS